MRVVLFGFFMSMLCLLGWGHPSSADIFTDLGLNGGQVYAIAVNPDNPDHLFVGIYLGDGLYVSADGGDHFEPVITGNPRGEEAEFFNHAIYDVTFAPSNGQIVWATNHYFMEKSGDGGSTWTHVTNGDMQGTGDDAWRMCTCIAIDPQNPSIVYVGTAKPYNSAGYTGAVYKTPDGGTTWVKMNGGTDLDNTVTDLAVDPQDSQRIWATTASSTDGYGTGALYLSTDGGDNFEPVNSEITVGAYYGVAVDPADSNTVYTGCDYGLFKHSYQDEAWTLAYAHSNAIFVADPVITNGTPSRIYAVWFSSENFGGDNLPKISWSEDGGTTWETSSLDSRYADFLNTIAVHPTDSSIVYVGDNTMGCLASIDGGNTFTPISQGINGVITYDVAVDPSQTTHMLAGTNAGLFERRSVDSGWVRIHSGISRSVCFDPVSSQTVYAGITLFDNYLYMSENGGSTWTQSEAFDSYISHICINPEETQTVYVTEGSRVQKSVDGGLTFETMLNPEAYRMNVVVLDPADPQHVFAGGGNFYNPRVYGNLWESLDGGANWSLSGLTDAIVNDVLIHPDNPMIMYAGCGFSANYQDILLKSLDGGATWQRSEQGLPNKTTWLLSVWGPSPDQIFAVGWDGFIVHVENGEPKVLDSGVTLDLNAVSGTDSEHVYAVGLSGTILFYDGQSWATQPRPVPDDLTGVWVSSANSVYAVGYNGTILHYNGGQWSSMASPTSEHLESVFGFSDTQIFAVGDNGTALFYDGTDWLAMDSSTGSSLMDIWGTDASHLYAVGTNGTILFYNGNGQNTWTAMDSGNTSYLYGVSGTTDGRVYVADAYYGVRVYENNTWSLMDSGYDLLGLDVWCVSATQMMVCAKNGGLFYMDGSTWSTVREPGNNGRTIVDLEFHKTNPDIVYAATYKAGIFVSPDAAGHWLNLGTPEYSVFAIATGSLYAATLGKLVQCTGTGVVAGTVRDFETGDAIDGAMVSSTLGSSSVSVSGDYMMVHSSGTCDLTASAEFHHDAVQTDVDVYGGEVSWVDFPMIGETLSIIDVLPVNDSGDEAVSPDQSSSSGSFCFIGSIQNNSSTSLPWGVAGILMGVVLFLMYHGRVNALKKTAVLCGLICLWPLADLNAATLFQQVGIASSPNVVGSGARALGMGGAFIATADDATAASWNPSGLVQVERPEVSLVGDFNRHISDFSSDIHREIANREQDSYGKANYLSATYPFHAFKNMVVSLNYQRLYDFDRDVSYTYDYNASGVDLVQDKTFTRDGSLGALGLAWAMEMTPCFSFGLTVNLWTDQLGWNNSWRASYLDTGIGTLGGATVTLTNQINETYSNFRGINANVGLLWETLPGLTLGAVVKTPFDADARHTYHSLSTSNLAPDSRYDLTEHVTIHMPMSYGLGLAYRMSDRLTLACDLYHTLWSDYELEDSQGNRFNPIDGLPLAQSDVSDTLQVRTGGEYLVLFPEEGVSVPLRAGLFYDPEPSHGSVRKFYGISLGSGIAIKQCSVDVAYQYRWSMGVDTGNLIATSTADVKQHTILGSVIFYF